MNIGLQEVEIQPNPLIENQPDNAQLYRMAKLKGKFGFKYEGNWIIQPKFEYLLPFDKEGYSCAQINGKYGYINKFGNWIIQPDFDELWGFDEENYCQATLNNKHGFINRLGEWIIHPDFDKLGYFDFEGCIAQISGKWGIINRQGEWIVEPKYDNLYKVNDIDCIRVSVENKYGFIKNNGDWIILPIFDSIISFDRVTGNIEGKINNQRILINTNPEYVLQSFFNGEYSHRIYFKENIPHKELNSFCENFNENAISKWCFYVYYNDSLFGNGRHGFAIAKKENEQYCMLISSSQGTFILNFNNGAIIFPLHQIKEHGLANIGKQHMESFVALIRDWAFSIISSKTRIKAVNLFTVFLIMNGNFDIFEILANIKMWKPELANELMANLNIDSSIAPKDSAGIR
jgi:uncharacterized protein (DUF3820 family)